MPSPSLPSGDRVFGIGGFGAHAELACKRESSPIAHKPADISFEEAAAVCDGACIALSCLRSADLRKGQSLLVYGASGSVGTAAVQLAKHFGADVTAVCNTKNVELVRSLGADRVIDYTREDYRKAGDAAYDVVFDAVGKTSFAGSSSRVASTGPWSTGRIPSSTSLRRRGTSRQDRRRATSS